MKLLYFAIIAAVRLSSLEAKSLEFIDTLVGNITEIEYSSQSTAYLLAESSENGNLVYRFSDDGIFLTVRYVATVSNGTAPGMTGNGIGELCIWGGPELQIVRSDMIKAEEVPIGDIGGEIISGFTDSENNLYLSTINGTYILRYNTTEP